MRHVDTLIIGQGIAGTTLAWQLIQNGKKVLVLDQEQSDSSSKIAAGLITPITGKRLVISWRFSQFYEAATEFYQKIEAVLGTEFFYRTGAVRFFSGEEEQKRFQKKLEDPLFCSLAQQRGDDESKELPLFSSSTGFEMPSASRLSVIDYLSHSRNYFEEKNCYQSFRLENEKEIQFVDHQVQIPRCDVSAKRLIFCRGAQERFNDWFAPLHFKPAKGEILSLRIPEYLETRTLHHQGWLACLKNQQYAAGSTYHWEQLDHVPTEEGKEQILSQLQKFNLPEFEILAHRAAVRPALSDQKPVIGFHPELKWIGIFNGLGSKGSLQAPWLAKQLADHLCFEKELNPEVDLKQKLDS